jgi:hypothetical protein
VSDLTERLRHVAWLAEEGSEVVDLAAAAKERISTLEALTDQLAEALRDAHGTAQRHAVCWCSTDSEYPADCDSITALRAYEADKEAHR